MLQRANRLARFKRDNRLFYHQKQRIYKLSARSNAYARRLTNLRQMRQKKIRDLIFKKHRFEQDQIEERKRRRISEIRSKKLYLYGQMLKMEREKLIESIEHDEENVEIQDTDVEVHEIREEFERMSLEGYAGGRFQDYQKRVGRIITNMEWLEFQRENNLM